MKKLAFTLFLTLFISSNSLHAELINNGDGTITDTATNLMWQSADSGYNMNMDQALFYVQSSVIKYSDWRLPDTVEIRSFIPKRYSSFSRDTFFWTVSNDGVNDYCVDFFNDKANVVSIISFCSTARVLAVRSQMPTDKKYSQIEIDNAVAQERKRWDANGDNKIGLAEAIRSLQIVSGARYP